MYIYITRPDKGSGVVINKMSSMTQINIICDNTLKMEIRLHKKLLESHKKIFLSKEVYDNIRPVGSQSQRMFVLPKIHKMDIPLTAILFMMGSAQLIFAKWLIEILDPVLDFYSVLDSFQFASK